MSGNVFLTSSEISALESDGYVNVSFARTGDASRAVNIFFEINIDPGEAGGAGFEDVTTPLSGTVTIPAGETRGIATIGIADDALMEGAESFYISTIGVDSGTLLFPRTARIDIIDDEAPDYGEPEPELISDYEVTETALFTGVQGAIAIEFSPAAPDLMYVAAKSGVIQMFDIATNEPRGELLNIAAETNASSDRGLLDFALHPDLANNPYVYVFHVVDPPETVGSAGNAGPDGPGNRFSHLVRYTLDEATGYSSIIPDSKVVLLGAAGRSLSDISGGGEVNSTLRENVDQPDSEIDPATGGYKTDYIKVDSQSHAGGSIAFGPDGALYVSTGDGTSYNLADPRSVSVQDVDSLAGKILRVDPLTGRGLPDNPFVDQAGGDLDANAAKVYQLGLRNPYSMAFDDDGELFITNTGWNRYESIFSGGPGANFGWPWYEGADGGVLDRAPGYPDLPEAQAFYDAVAAGEIVVTPAYRAFSHNSADPGFQVQAITGADMVVSSPNQPDSLQDYFIFADIVQGEVFAVHTDDRRDVKFLYRTDNYAPAHFEMGPDGEIYFANVITQTVGRLDIQEKSGEFEFGGSRYIRLEDGLSRADAGAQAEALGGHILSVDSQAEQDWVMSTFWESRAIYLDLSDAEQEGRWERSDGNLNPYSNWLPGEPNNDGGVQDYAVIADSQGRWDDQAADGAGVLIDGQWTSTESMSIVEIGAAPLPRFGGSAYELFEAGVGRAEAQARAEANGGSLLRIGDQAEQDWIMGAFWDDRAIYLDASDAGTEGLWVDSDGEELAYVNWLRGQPDDYGGGQDYAVIASAWGAWDDKTEDESTVLDWWRWRPSEAMAIAEYPDTAIG